jgi:SAM-dependent methyltransferase
MTKDDLKPLDRFSTRVDNYVRYRPSYPDSVLQLLGRVAGLGSGTPVADVGSGTGIFARLLLEAGARVLAVEPNDAMRAAAEVWLGGNPGFVSVKGSAEATGLAEGSVSLVTCAQAFHWFDTAGTRREFMRILGPAGWCALVWNIPTGLGAGFGAGFEGIKERFGTDYQRVRQETMGVVGQLDGFYGNRLWERHTYPYSQELDHDALKGRMESSSFMPAKGHPNHLPMLEALRQVFDRFQSGGRVLMEYETRVFLGQFT